jgi:hypothetical protein
MSDSEKRIWKFRMARPSEVSVRSELLGVLKGAAEE